MSTALWLFGSAVAAACAAYGVRSLRRRRRRLRRLALCEADVAKAVADGRLQRATGEMLLQHLDGLRRECSGANGS